jgi:methylmalonyl-CoA mutase N-terminal domain/subunit
MMKERYGAKNERSWFMKTHVQTAGCSLTEQQPLNNVVRVAYQAMAAVLGGCQSLHTDSMDETLGLPTEQAVTVALRTQQILAYETGVTRTVDPLGGSWFIEELTDKMEAGALELIDEIDRMGTYGNGQMANGQRAKSGAQAAGSNLPTGSLQSGSLAEHPAYAPRTSYGRSVVAGINKGYFRRQIAEASYRFSEECEANDRIIVGVNAFTEGSDERPLDILQISHQVESDQCSRLAAFKQKRDAKGVEAALNSIREAARADQNVMPALVEGALANCTLGEMVQALADVYGRYGGGPEW